MMPRPAYRGELHESNQVRTRFVRNKHGDAIECSTAGGQFVRVPCRLIERAQQDQFTADSLERHERITKEVNLIPGVEF